MSTPSTHAVSRARKQPRSVAALVSALLMAAALLGHGAAAHAKRKAARPKADASAAPAAAEAAPTDGSAAPEAGGTSTGTDASPAPASGTTTTAATTPAATEAAPAQSGAATPVAQPSAAGDSANSSASSSPTPAPAAVSAEESAKLAGLRSELTTLMDELVEARSRAAIVGKTLFKTRMAVRLQNLAGPDPVLAKVVLKLDGAAIYRGDAASLGGDEARNVFEGFVAPGPHVLGVELEQRARDDAAYGYTLRESYRIQAPREKQTELTLVLDDDSDMAGDFPDDGDGKYDVRMRLRAKTRAWKEHER